MTPPHITPRFRRRNVRTDDAARPPAAPLPHAPTPAAAPTASPACPSPASNAFDSMAKSEHLYLKSGPSPKAIPRLSQNGHQRGSWYEETEEAQLSMYQPNPDFREPQ